MIAQGSIRKVLGMLVVLAAALAAVYPVYAGGWAVITLDQLPVNVIVGQPFTLGMTARHHGRSPLQMDSLAIGARHVETGELLTVKALPDTPAGHYRAELLFPRSGAWEWWITSGLFPKQQPMPTLVVNAIAAQGAVAPVNSLFSANRGLLGGSALLALAAGAVLLARGRKSALRTALGKTAPNTAWQKTAGAGLIVLCVLLAAAFYLSASTAAQQVQAAALSTSNSSVGQQLFVAKGCVVCHVNSRAITQPEDYSVSTGPVLSSYRNDTDYLRKFLANPQGVRPGIEMPNLRLSTAEINELVDFLNQP